jgi:hypothetical protein
MKVVWVCWNGDRVSHFHGNFPKLRALIPLVHYSQRIVANAVMSSVTSKYCRCLTQIFWTQHCVLNATDLLMYTAGAG